MVIENRKKYSLVIGIDTGVHTGIATWNVASRRFELIATTSIHKARDEERKMLQGVGSVKRDAKIWEDFLTDIGIPFEMTHPKNSVTKLNDLSFRKLTKYSKRTSEHSRDAAMLVFGY